MQHLTLCQRKALCGRTQVLGAMARHDSDVAEAEEFDAFVSARGHLLSTVTRAMSNGKAASNEIRLDEYLRDASARAKELQDTCRLSPTVYQALDSARVALRTIDCSACAGGQVCNGSDDDDEIVARSGHCLTPFISAFQLASEQTEAYYAQHSSDFSALPKVRVLFETAIHKRPHSCGVAEYIGGTTAYRDQGGQLTSVVTLNIGVEDFDLQSLRAATYVLFHECICHVYNGNRPGASGRNVTSPADRFAEGWMDWVASRVYDRVVSGGLIRSQHSAPTRRDFDQGEELRKARIDIYPSVAIAAQEQRQRAPRFVGTYAAQRFHEYLRDYYGEHIGWEHFLRISFDLNLERDMADQREDFVVFINNRLHQNPPFDELRRGEVASLVRNYLSGKQVATLLAS